MSAGWLIALCASIIVIIVGTAIICFVAMGKKKQIKDVKNASIQLSGASYTATYGELFSKSIGGAKWDYFKEDGEKLVQVTGDYNDKLNNRTDPIIVQFNVDDGVKLSCIAINSNALSLTDSERVITEMYNSYYGAGNTTVSTNAGGARMQDRVARGLLVLLEAAAVVPQVRYVGWDIAVTDYGLEMIEGNEYPSHPFFNFRAHHPDGYSLRHDFEKKMGI